MYAMLTSAVQPPHTHWMVAFFYHVWPQLHLYTRYTYTTSYRRLHNLCLQLLSQFLEGFFLSCIILLHVTEVTNVSWKNQ
ncbi:hypothetical protein GDO81_003198 [Engystomops pustulosus]|uniref:Uncharacterized protein n=1 Tax=Engystomops pustulosus TaxID=76066 RepID=A0AAV6ZZQ5_ENGPU|nr:hypothetical protein GDO81_003198 [Engystomops pustulosus]